MKWYGEPIKNGCYYLFRNAIIVKSRFWKRNCYYYLKDQVLHLVVAANYKVVNSKRVIFDHQKFRKWFSDYRLIIFRSYLFPQKTNYTDYLYKGPSINDVGNWVGGEGSKIGQTCRRIVLKNCRHEGGGYQKSGKIANIVHGWSLVTYPSG